MRLLRLARHTKKAVLTRTLDVVCERRYGTRTSDVIIGADYAAHIARQGIAAGEQVGHLASAWLTLPRILDRREVDRTDVFLDAGCGQGRMLVEAAVNYPFGRVIGIELSSELAAAARRNVARAGRFIRTPVDVVEANAGDWEIPPEVTVVYLFNPFRGQVFSAFTERLVASLDNAPRRLRVVYALPREEEALLATGRFRRVRVGRGLVSPRRRHAYLSLYETIA